jgi:hypothetical protein
MEKISAFMTFVIYQIYRKQHLRAKAGNLESVNEHFWFMIEEAHNLLDSTVIAKKTFNKLRKIQNEFRNLKMHMVCIALRLQDLSPKIRSKMSILLSRVSLDDYQLKVRNLLRNSTYRDEITQLTKGKFIFPSLDLELNTKPFTQQGKPYEAKPQTAKQSGKPNIIQRLVKWYTTSKKRIEEQKQQRRNNPDQSVYSDDPRDTQEDDMEEDLALLDDDMGW